MAEANTVKSDYPPIRRLVTGHDANNVAKVLMDAPATNHKSSGPGTVSTLIWSTDAAPADIAVGETIDYVIVIAGEIDMDMDDSTVHLRAGDVMVQRGTNHAWVNRGTERARVAFVLVDAKPLGIGHPIVRGEKAS